MRQLAGSLLAGLLLQITPLFAQKVLTASIRELGDLTAEASPFKYVNEDPSDTVVFNSNWDFGDWDIQTFNPYHEQDLSDPFYLSFIDQTYAAPVDRSMVITSRYGWRDGILHRGIDIDLVTGDEVYAILDGKVRYVRSHAGHGKTVVIRHENGLETVYAHLSKQLVKENQIVKKGEQIGKGGTTGNARGSHLHLEIRYEGVTINPEYFFDFESNREIKARESWITTEVTDPRRYSSVKKGIMSVAREMTKTDSDTTAAELSSDEQLSQNIAPDEPAHNESIVQLSASANEAPTTGPYTIKYGDTLYSLARKHQTTVDEICRVNGIGDSFKIKVGQKILLDF